MPNAVTGTQSEVDADANVLHWWWRGVTVIAGIVAIASCIFAIRWKHNLPVKFTIAVVWSLGPPCWFMFQRWRLIPKYSEKIDSQQWRDGADLATKVWAGVGLLLAFLYT
jgi:hypothetical protein